MNQIKIVHVANYDLGLKIHLGNYMRFQRDQGYCVSAITNPGKWIKQDTTILDGIFVKVMRFNPRISPIEDLKTLVHLLVYFRQEKFDIIHTHTVKPGLLGRIAAKTANAPIIVHTVHGFYFYDKMPRWKYAIYTTIEKLGATCCDLILSQNKQDIDTAISEGIASPEKIKWLGNGIDLLRFDPSQVTPEKTLALRNELGILPCQKVIGFIARWEREKGVYEFLEAAKILKSKGVTAVYLMVGPFQSQKTSAVLLPEIVQKLGLEKEIILLGHRDDIPEIISTLDVVVLPSHGREGIPRILMESAAMGKPVVATKVRGNIEAVEDGITGVLVPPQDAAALADGIFQIINNEEYSINLGLNARKRAITNFDERTFFGRTDVEYRRLLRLKLGIDASLFLNPTPDTFYVPF